MWCPFLCPCCIWSWGQCGGERTRCIVCQTAFNFLCVLSHSRDTLMEGFPITCHTMSWRTQSLCLPSRGRAISVHGIVPQTSMSWGSRTPAFSSISATSTASQRPCFPQSLRWETSITDRQASSSSALVIKPHCPIIRWKSPSWAQLHCTCMLLLNRQTAFIWTQWMCGPERGSRNESNVH